MGLFTDISENIAAAAGTVINQIITAFTTPLDSTALLTFNSIGVALMLFALERLNQIDNEVEVWNHGSKILPPPSKFGEKKAYRLIVRAGIVYGISIAFLMFDRPDSSCSEGCKSVEPALLTTLATNSTIIGVLLTLAAFYFLFAYKGVELNLRPDGTKIPDDPLSTEQPEKA